jgi:hypothetical protein
MRDTVQLHRRRQHSNRIRMHQHHQRPATIKTILILTISTINLITINPTLYPN